MHAAKVFFMGIILALSFSAPAQTLEDVITSPTTFAVCKTVDVVSTMYLINSGIGIEANPLVAWSIQVGGYLPLILVSIGLYYWLKELNSPVATGFANVVTCAVAGSNLSLL